MFMPFGKYRGQHIYNVPTSYLRWLLNEANGLWPWERHAVEDELFRRGYCGERSYSSNTGSSQGQQASGAVMLPRDDVKARVASWYHRLARQHHPDVGGDAKVFVALNAAHKDLVAALGLEG